MSLRGFLSLRHVQPPQLACPSERVTALAGWARTAHGLEATRQLEVTPGSGLVARYSSDGPGGWVISHDCVGRPVGWLEQLDAESWAAAGVTGEHAWWFAPTSWDLQPRLVALDRRSQPVAISEARRFGGRRVILGRDPDGGLSTMVLNRSRRTWRLTAHRTEHARIVSRGRGHLPSELRFTWHEQPPEAGLATLFVAYVIAAESLVGGRHAAGPIGN